MRHNPNNGACDKNVYPGAPDIKCTCDLDDADEIPAPSVVMPPGLQPPAVNPFAMQAAGPMSSREGAAYAELKAAARELDAARAMLKPAEERWRRALDTLHEAMLRP